MKTDTTKFLAVLAVFAMAFAGFAAVAVSEENDASSAEVNIKAMIDMAKVDGAVDLTPDDANGDVTVTLKADGYIYNGSTTTSLGKWENGFYNESGGIIATIDNGATIVINGTACGIAAIGAITITASEGAALTVNVTEVIDDEDEDERAGGIIATDAITIENVALKVSCNASASLATGAGSYGLYSGAALTLTDCSGTVFGGSMGAYAVGKIVINGGDWTVAGYERGLRSYANVEIGTSTATTVTANIIDGDGTNGAGCDARFGVKAEGTLIVGKSGDATVKSTLETMGLYTKTAITPLAGSKIIVQGGYEQTKAADYSKPWNAIVGFACEAATVEANSDLEHIASADKATAGKISIVEGAEVYNYLIPEYSAEYDAKDAADVATINTTISSATYEDNSVVYVDLTANSTITSLEGLEIPAGKTVIIEPKTDVEYYGTITLASSTSVVKLVGMKLEETAATGILKIVGGTGSEVTIAPAASGTTVSATIGYGSVVIKDISVSGATTLNVTVSGDVKIVGTVGAGATVNIIKAADKTADVIISKELYNSGTIIFGEVTLTAEKEITNYGTFTFDEKTVIGSQITIIGGNVQGTIDGSTLILKGEVNASGNITVNGKMTIAEGAKLTLDSTDKLTINENAKLNVYGKIILSVNTASVENNGTIYVLSKDAVIPDKISGTGTIEFEAIEEIVELKGNLRDATFHQYQAVYITGDSSIVENSKVVVNGKITVNPGVTLTITDGSYLAVLNSYGKIVNYGKIVILAGAAAAPTYNGTDITGEGLIVSNATFENYGEIQFDYTPATGTTALYSGSFMDQANVLNYGDITIFESNIVDLGKTAIAKFVNYADATLTINGQIDFSAVHTMKTITNYGAVVVNGILEDGDDVIIDQVANGATVVVTKLAGDAAVGKLTITDTGIDAVAKKTFVGHNSIVITDATVKDSFSGLLVTTSTKMGSTANYVYMDIAGALDAENSETTTPAATVAMTGDYVTMNTIMTMTKEITLTGKLTVNGLMTLEDGSMYKTSGAVTVYGALVAGKNPINAAITVNAAMFVTGTTEKTYTYTTLDKAIAGAEEEDVNLVTATGNVAVTDSIDIPAGMTVKQLSGVITIGSATNNSVVLTVEDGAKIDQTAGNIYVYGTLYVENKNTGIKKSPSVTADVKEESATFLIYTNIVNALSITPTEPTTVTLFNNVEVTTDITIPEFVTLDTNGKDFKIKGATLTIDGMLYLNGGAYNVDNVPGTIPKEGKVVLNGYIKNADFMTYDGKKFPAGAYFSVSDSGTFYYITPVSIAASCAMIADDNTISIYGKNTVGTVSFEGTADEPVFVNVNGEIASGTFELSHATMTIAADQKINMTVSCATGSIAFKNEQTSAKTVITASVVLEMPVLSMTAGTIVKSSALPADSTNYNTTFDGDVILKDVTIVKGTIDGTVVASGSVQFTEKVVVNDTLVANNASTLKMADVTVYGNLTAAEATSTKSAGSIVIDGTLTAGDNEYAGSDAVVTGNVTAAFYIVYDGTTFEGKVSETLADLIDDKKYTAFYVLDELWFTYLYTDAKPTKKIVEVTEVDDKKTITYNYQPKGLEDSVFDAWQKVVSGELVTITTATQVGDVQAVYALIDYEIYSVDIVTDSGIKSIAINGIQMVYEGNVFSMYGLTAGTYKVTYTLKSGYEGTAVLSTMTGTILKDNSFTLSGTDDDDLIVTFQLAGTEPIPEPEPTPTPTPEEKSEWTVTTILLCILVVLIAIMAVIVALRLNRN